MLVLVFALLGSVLSSSVLPQSPNVGASCTVGKAVYNISTFTVSPWPIQTQSTVSVVMTGYLSSPAYVDGVWVSSSSYTTVDTQQIVIGQQYFPGNISFPFIYQVQYPASNWNVIVTLRDSNFNALSCWKFSYSSY